MGGGASLGSGAQGGSCALRSGCGAEQCSGGESRERRAGGHVPPPCTGSQCVPSVLSVIISVWPRRRCRLQEASCSRRASSIASSGSGSWACSSPRSSTKPRKPGRPRSPFIEQEFVTELAYPDVYICPPLPQTGAPAAPRQSHVCVPLRRRPGRSVCQQVHLRQENRGRRR